MADDSEQMLPGFIDRIVRVADTVRRPAEPWTPAVAALLQHYEQEGFALAPRHLGYDAEGRQVLSFMAGGTINERTVDPLVLGSAVRRLHDAGQDFVMPAGTCWHNGTRSVGEGEVLCHNDLGPWNILGTDDEVSAFIDFDTVAPKNPKWELADLAYRFGPLYPDDFLARFDWHPTIGDRASRIVALLDGYGWPRSRRQEVVAVLVDNLQQHVDRLIARAGLLEGRAGQVNRDGAAVDAASRDWTAEHMPALASALS